VHKFWLIARHEYLRIVRRRTFLLATLGLPVLIIAALGISVAVNTTGGAHELGYVDQRGVLGARLRDPGFPSYSSVNLAQTDLEAGKIRGFYVIPADYPSSSPVQLYYWEREPGATLRADFASFLKANIAASLPPAVAARVLDGPTNVVVNSADGSREMDSGGIGTIILPFVLGLFLSFALLTASGYLLRAVAEEKENRTIEVLTSSVSAEQLIAGKAVGLVGVALSQVFLWAVVAIGGVSLASLFVASLGGLQVSWTLAAMLIVFFVPLFGLAAALIIMFGVVTTDFRQNQQLVGIMSVLFLLPLVFSPLLGSSPDGPAMIALTLFPTTSLLTTAIRWGATTIPWWQLLGSWLILAGCAALAVWAAPRVFRREMLRYGQGSTFRRMVAAMRGRA
jgi:ABC-2 type transport system permease protein